MCCPLNKRKWWIFKWEGAHEWVAIWIGRWAFDLFEIKRECIRCGDIEKDFGLKSSQIIRAGYDIEKAKYNGDYYRGYGYDPRETNDHQ